MQNPEGLDYGFRAFYDNIETTIQGNTTYQQVIAWDLPFPYKGKENFVVTNNKHLSKTENVSFINSEHLSNIRELKEKEGGDIWLIGGGEMNTFFLENELLDEIIVFIMPIVLENGIDLFNEFVGDKRLILKTAQTYSTGAVEIRYDVHYG